MRQPFHCHRHSISLKRRFDWTVLLLLSKVIFQPGCTPDLISAFRHVRTTVSRGRLRLIFVLLSGLSSVCHRSATGHHPVSGAATRGREFPWFQSLEPGQTDVRTVYCRGVHVPTSDGTIANFSPIFLKQFSSIPLTPIDFHRGRYATHSCVGCLDKLIVLGSGATTPSRDIFAGTENKFGTTSTQIHPKTTHSDDSSFFSLVKTRNRGHDSQHRPQRPGSSTLGCSGVYQPRRGVRCKGRPCVHLKLVRL